MCYTWEHNPDDLYTASAYQWVLPKLKTALCSQLHEHIQSEFQAYFAVEKYRALHYHTGKINK